MDEQYEPRDHTLPDDAAEADAVQAFGSSPNPLGDLTPEQADIVMEGGDLQPCDMPESTESADEDILCENCGEFEKDSSVSPDYPYCSACHEAMKKQKIGWEAVLMAAVFFCFSLFAVYLLIAQWPMISASMKGEYYTLCHRYVDAYQEFNSVSGQVTKANEKLGGRQLISEGYKPGIRLLRMYAKAASPISAGYYAQQQYEQEELDSFLYRELGSYAQEYTVYTGIVSSLITPYQESMGDDFDITAIPYAEFAEKAKEIVSKDKQSAMYALYLQALVAQSTEQSEQDCIAVLKQLEALAPKRIDLYANDMIQLYQSMGDTANALAYCDRLEKFNRNDDLPYQVRVSVELKEKDYAAALDIIGLAAKKNPNSAVQYELKAEVLRRQEKLADALKVCVEATAGQLNSTELQRQQIIIYLLQENYEEAYSMATDIVSSYSYQGSTPPEKMLYVWAICASVAEDGKEDFADWKASAKESGYTIPTPMQAFLDGTKTIKDLFLSGEGDVL